MFQRLMVLLITGLLLSSGLVRSMSAPDQGSPTGTAPTEDISTLTANEEDDPAGGRRVRVSTPTVRINDLQGSLTLRLECLHPAGKRQPPDQCIVNVIHRDVQARYSLQHDTRFQVGMNRMQVFDGKLASYGTRKEGPEVVEPLIGFWDFKLIKKLATSQYKVEFLLEKDKVGVDKGCIAVLQDMVKYFE